MIRLGGLDLQSRNGEIDLRIDPDTAEFFTLFSIVKTGITSKVHAHSHCIITR